LLGGSSATFMNNTWLIPGFSAEIFLIQFHSSGKRKALRCRDRHLANGMSHFPGGWLGNANPSG
jgi:hypothetical protein